MEISTISLRNFDQSLLSRPQHHTHDFGPRTKTSTVLAMARKKVEKYDKNWKKTWYGQGYFYEASEDMDVDVFRKLEKKKALSTVEKSRLLSKADELGFTLSTIEKLGIFSKAEQLGLLSLLEKVAGASPSALASSSIPLFTAAVLAVVLIPDDSTALVAVQAVVAATFGVAAVALYIGSIILDGLQESD